VRRLALLVVISFIAVQGFSQIDWPTYGHDAGGLRYSPLRQIDPTNVSKLKVAWVYDMKPSDAPEIMAAARSPRRNGQVVGPPGGQENIASEDGTLLPEGEGRDVTERVCSTCHSTDIFARQHHTRGEWSSIIDNMVSNGLGASHDQLDEIRNYLVVNLSPQANTQNAGVAQSTIEGVTPQRRGGGQLLSSEMTPIVAGGLMYLSSPYHKIVALDPITGKHVWSYITPGDGVPSLRGLEYWPGDGVHPPEVLCGTRDGKLIALFAKTGEPVKSFGTDGVIDMKTPEAMNGQVGLLGMTSPPIIYKNLVITGSIVPEFPGIGPSGDVRAWDVLTGKLVWTFHSIPRPTEEGHETWLGDGWKNRTGVNVWGFLTVDTARGILYMPFGAPSWDRYGGDREGNNLFGTTLVAADANTGKELWHFQIVHHDIWDYDLDSPPVLLEIKHGLKRIPAVAIVSKSSMAFFFNRVTGRPIYPIEERPVPKSDVPGEVTSPTQPFPMVTPPLARQNFTMEDIATVTPELEAFCRDFVAKNKVVFGPIYTPVPYQRTFVQFPGTNGGPDWGGVSFNPTLDLMFVNTQDLGQVESLVPRPGGAGAPYMIGPVAGRFWDSEGRLPCQKPPWGRLLAINVNTGKIVWQVPLGITDSLPEGKRNTGRPNLGGSIATASGLVFIGATDDSRFRAFDAKTGDELWSVKLEAAAHAVPSTYEGKDGKQYVVITSTGGSNIHDPITGASVIAFALPNKARSRNK
jgi:quinoprotein glucose dehydrogenase